MSRYYDYDYDRNCIIGFGSDDTDDHYNISPNSSQSGDSIPLSTYGAKNTEEIASDDDDDDDIFYIQHLDNATIKSHKLKPIKLDVPFLLISDLIKQQQIIASFSDRLDDVNTDKNLLIQHESTYTSIQRIHDFNGSYYNTFGSVTLRPNTIRIWRFQIIGNAPSIIGITESDTTTALNGAYFGYIPSTKSYSFNTITAQCYTSSSKPIYQQMLRNGVLDEPMIIDLRLDLYRGTMSIKNNTLKSQHFGKEILLFDDIDTTKSYKLAIALLGADTINLF